MRVEYRASNNYPINKIYSNKSVNDSLVTFTLLLILIA